jgi:hypothetical protein
MAEAFQYIGKAIFNIMAKPFQYNGKAFSIL